MTSSNLIQIRINGRLLETSPCSLAELLRQQGIPQEGIAVACNQTVVPRVQHEATMLEPGDVIEILHAVSGG